MKKTKKVKTAEQKTPARSEQEQKNTSGTKFGILGKDISSKFQSRSDRAWKPTKPGGRNGQGKPT